MNRLLILYTALMLVASSFAQDGLPQYKINEGVDVYSVETLYLDNDTKEYITKKVFVKKYGKDEFKIIKELVEIAEKKRIKEKPLCNFYIKETGVIWQYVYEVDLDRKQIRDYFEAQTFMKLQKLTEASMVFTLDKFSFNIRKSGSWGTTPMYLNDPISGSVTVQSKDNKYRITVSNIVFTSSMDLNFGGVSTNGNDQTPLEEYAYNYKRDVFKSLFTSSGANAMNNLLLDLFEIKEIESITSDNW